MTLASITRLVVFVAIAGNRVASATSYAPPEKHDVRSANGSFVLHVDPEAGTLTVESTRAPTTPWAIQRRIGFESFHVANDGRSIAIVAWHFVKLEDLDEPALELWNASGRFQSYSYRELVARPQRIHGVGPIGGFWRDWLVGAEQDGDRLTIVTTGSFEYTIDIGSGEQTGRSWRFVAIGRWLLGFALLGLAIGVIVRTRRALAATEYRSERNMLVLSVAAPIGALVWLWLDFAGVPFAPAEAMAYVASAVLITTLVVAIGSIVAAVRVPGGSRALRLAFVIGSIAAVLALRLFY